MSGGHGTLLNVSKKPARKGVNQSRYPARETYALLLGALGTVLAVPAFGQMNWIGTLIAVPVALALLGLVYWKLPSLGRAWKRVLLGSLTAAFALLGLPVVVGQIFPAPHEYETTTYAPFVTGTQTAKSSLTVEEQRGECFNFAERSARQDAFRCISGDALLDPCFVGYAHDPPILVCANSPWDRNVVRLTSVKALPKDDWRERGWPWAIELETGERCTFVPSENVGDTQEGRVNYDCDSGSSVFEVDLQRGTARVQTTDVGIADARLSHVWP